jgi:hypothetical protein
MEVRRAQFLAVWHRIYIVVSGFVLYGKCIKNLFFRQLS